MYNLRKLHDDDGINHILNDDYKIRFLRNVENILAYTHTQMP